MEVNREPLMISVVRTALTRIGAHITSSQMYWLERVMSQLKVGGWFVANGFPFTPLYSCRPELYAALARGIADEQVLYLEFGVFRGETTRYWSSRLKNPRACLHGFDSFEGLPEDWNAQRPMGYFSTRGEGSVSPLSQP